MSIWTSNQVRPGRLLRSGALLCAGFALAGCLGDGAGGGVSFATRDQQPKAGSEVTRQVALARGNVVVAGPKGYCVDPASVSRKQGGFALLASCEVLSGTPGARVDPAVMTVSVLPRRLNAQQPQAKDLVASLAPAQAHLTRDGDGVAIAHLAAGGDTVLPQGDPAHWRAAMVINGHLVGLAVYGRKGSPVTGAAGETLIRDLSESLREASPVKDYTPVANTTKSPQQPQGRGLRGVFSGLFPNRG